jgi:hypothetical protein
MEQIDYLLFCIRAKDNIDSLSDFFISYLNIPKYTYEALVIDYKYQEELYNIKKSDKEIEKLMELVCRELNVKNYEELRKKKYREVELATKKVLDKFFI